MNYCATYLNSIFFLGVHCRSPEGHRGRKWASWTEEYLSFGPQWVRTWQLLLTLSRPRCVFMSIGSESFHLLLFTITQRVRIEWIKSHVLRQRIAHDEIRPHEGPELPLFILLKWYKCQERKFIFIFAKFMVILNLEGFPVPLSWCGSLA